MNTLGSFIESEAFFPILILLLLLLIGVFIWLVLSNKKQEKMYRGKKQNIKIDESAQIKIIDQGFNNNYDNHITREKIELSSNYKKEIQNQNNDLAISNKVHEKENNEISQTKETVQELSEEDKKIMEAFELPNLKDNDLSDKELEREIIEAANQYIFSVMHKKDEESQGDINSEKS